jgi:hypothetical protein
MSSALFPRPPAPLPAETDADSLPEIKKITDPGTGLIRKLFQSRPANFADYIQQGIDKAVILYGGLVEPASKAQVKKDLVDDATKVRAAAQKKANAKPATYKVPNHDKTRRHEARDSIAALQKEGIKGGDADMYADAIQELAFEIHINDLSDAFDKLR